jgi:hypothetical protein
MLCGFFCVFWSSLGILQLPTAGIASSYSPTGNALKGALTADYNAGIALYISVLGFAVFTIFLVTLRTNAVLAVLFVNATAGLFTLSASYWRASIGHFPTALHLKHVRTSICLCLPSANNIFLGFRRALVCCGYASMVFDLCAYTCRNGLPL